MKKAKFGGLLVFAAALAAALAIGFFRNSVSGADNEKAATGSEGDKPAAPEKSDFPVVVRKPDGPPKIPLHKTPDGKQLKVICSTCHATREPNPQKRLATDLTEFHKGMTFTHGSLVCFSCHNSTDYDSLRLSDGTRVEYPDVMTLCAQCHGAQYRDYQHGAHGGMTGYWDLSRGGRQRNNCINCHEAHVPKYQPAGPAAGPNDRFRVQKAHVKPGAVPEPSRGATNEAGKEQPKEVPKEPVKQPVKE